MRTKHFSVVLWFILHSAVHSAFSQSSESRESRYLTGHWQFLEATDPNNKKINPANKPGEYGLITGPLMVYNPDSTYSKKFNSESMDSGTWSYDPVNRLILHKLYYSLPYSRLNQYMIDNGLAKKDAQGKYYEVSIDSVLSIESHKLVIRDGKRNLSFIKVAQ